MLMFKGITVQQTTKLLGVKICNCGHLSEWLLDKSVSYQTQPNHESQNSNDQDCHHIILDVLRDIWVRHILSSDTIACSDHHQVGGQNIP